MNKEQHAALSKIVKNIADELDKFDSLLTHVVIEDYDTLEEHYLKLNDAWYWLNSYVDEQEIQDENPARLQ